MAPRRSQRPQASLSLAGFQMTFIGRFWVTAEGEKDMLPISACVCIDSWLKFPILYHLHELLVMFLGIRLMVRLPFIMVFPYLIDQTRRFARVTLSGSVHGHEIAAAMEAMYQDPNWAAEFDILWDASEITELLLDGSDFLGFVRVQKKYAAVGPRREIILARRALDRAMARTYALFMKAGAHRVHVCQSEEEANELLKQ